MKSAIIEVHEDSAGTYDNMSVLVEYHGHEVLFGLVYEYLLPGDMVLDIGIGTGLSSYLFHKAGLKVYGIDGSEKMLEICRKKGFVSELKLYNLADGRWPYRDGQFKNATACGLFHFYKELDVFFMETSRILRKDGTFSFTVMVSEDCHQQYTDTKFGIFIFYHNNVYITKLTEKYGFNILKCIPFFVYKSSDKDEKSVLRGYLLKKV